MYKVLKDWNGSFDMDSVAATVYQKWYMQFLLSLFHSYSDNVDDRLSFTGNYHFKDSFQFMIEDILENKSKSRYQPICKGAYPSYNGDDHCGYNIAKALLETKHFLRTHVSEHQKDWKWGKIHSNEYPNLPWSKTALKPLFHKSTPVGGNENTPKFTKTSIRKDWDKARIGSYASGGLKMLVQVAEKEEDDVSYISIDTGI